jgi:glycosyltransferase involved in cell wall biosynthesis
MLSASRAAGETSNVVAIFPEPTPYRAPLFDRIAARGQVDLLVVYAARTVARRTWDVALGHPHAILRGARIPGLARILRHDYPITPGVIRVLERERPDCVVVSGWSTFASQVTIAWCRLRRTRYVLVVESHDRDPRPGWRRAIKGAVVPRVVRGAAEVLVTGTLARESMVVRGAEPGRIGVFANTIDVPATIQLADGLSLRRSDLRRSFGLSEDDVVVLAVGRLAPEKRIDVLVDAVAGLESSQVALLLAGDGRERPSLQRRADVRGVRAVFAGELAGERLIEAYVAADVFALLSSNETWGVVVNEAAACGLPLVLSDRVGAGYDLLEPGRNGARVPAGDVAAATRALAELVASPEARRQAGAASRELVAGWGYESSIDDFTTAVCRAVGPGRDA